MRSEVETSRDPGMSRPLLHTSSFEPPNNAHTLYTALHTAIIYYISHIYYYTHRASQEMLRGNESLLSFFDFRELEQTDCMQRLVGGL